MLAVMVPQDFDQIDEQKLAEMSAAVAGRLIRVCEGMDAASFDALVHRIATFKIKWGESILYDNPPALGAWMFGRDNEPDLEK